MRWTVEQRRIFAAVADPTSGHLGVRARAGTGKTTTIVEAVGRVPDGTRTLLTAFNRRNADDLYGRLLDVGARTASARTLHSLGLAVLQSCYDVVVDPQEGRNVARVVCGERSSYELRSAVARLASLAKTCLLPEEADPDALEALAMWFGLAPTREQKRRFTLGRLVRLTRDALAHTTGKTQGGSFSIDFDDMVWLPIAVGATRREYDLVVVDEAQDMSRVQLALARSAVLEAGRLVVVGDDRQAVYGFRGADARGFDRTLESLGATVLPLTRTFRCPRSVVELVRGIVPDYSCPSDAPDGSVRRAPRSGLPTVVRPGCLVLSRTNAGAVAACLEILRSGTPAEVAGVQTGERLVGIVERAAVPGASLALVLQNVRAWRREQRAEIRRKFPGRDHHPVRDTFLDKLDDEVATIEAVAAGLETVDELRSAIRDLFGDGTDRDRVTCSTVHRAKGGERDLVVVLEDTLGTGSVDEENIRYVAYTRARRELVLLSSEYVPDPDPHNSPDVEAVEIFTDGGLIPVFDPTTVTVLDDRGKFCDLFRSST